MQLVSNRSLVSRYPLLLGAVLLVLALLFTACGDTDATPVTNSQVATTLLSQATPLCQNSQKAEVAASENLALSKPVIFLTSNSQAGKWSEFFNKSNAIPADYADLQAKTTDAVKGVVCVSLNYVVVGKYVPLSPASGATASSGDDKAYRQDLEVWVVSYPDGKVVARNNFKGAEPASEITNSVSHYGPRPDKDMLNWLKSQLK